MSRRELEWRSPRSADAAPARFDLLVSGGGVSDCVRSLPPGRGGARRDPPLGPPDLAGPRCLSDDRHRRPGDSAVRHPRRTSLSAMRWARRVLAFALEVASRCRLALRPVAAWTDGLSTCCHLRRGGAPVRPGTAASCRSYRASSWPTADFPRSRTRSPQLGHVRSAAIPTPDAENVPAATHRDLNARTPVRFRFDAAV